MMSNEHWLQTMDGGLVRTDRIVSFDFTEDGFVEMTDILGRKYRHATQYEDAGFAKQFIIGELNKAHVA